VPRILVIDDQSHVRAAILLILKARDFDVVAAENGASSLIEFETSDFDLAIIDIYMPGMDGVKLIKALRERKPNLPVVAISGVTLGASGRTVLDHFSSLPNLSRIVCLQKPFRPADLLKAMERAYDAVSLSAATA
jgi:CheY-like chemotaxis protein